MSHTILEFQATPNPNAVKCVLDRPIRDRASGPASFRDAAAAQSSPVAAALFASGGITSVLINDDWITVNKEKDAEWEIVKKNVTKVLSEA